MSEIGAGGSASLAISRCAISSLGLSRNSTVADFRFHSRKTGDFITTTITVELVSAIERAEKHKSPSTLRRDAARAQQYQQRRQSSRAVHQAAHHVSSQSQVSSSIGESKELPASSSSISAPSGPPSVSIQRPLLAKRARTLSTRVEAVNPPLLAPSSSSPASMALERPMSLNSSPTKETMTDTTSGTRSGSIQAPAVVPTYSTIVSSSSAPATPPRLPSSSGRLLRPTAAPPDSSSAPVDRSPSSFWKGLKAAIATARENR